MPQPGELLGGRYRLDDRIAAGGMGEVWRASDMVLGRPVAVKTLLAGYAGDAGFRSRFQHEARAMASLRHAGVVPVYDFGDTGDGAYLVMARVDGQPLDRRIAERGSLSPAETMSIVAQAARALAAAHEAGIIHRDVKPGNLIIEPDGTVVLVDFGVARSAHSQTLTGVKEVVGTALYMAPEQVSKQTTGPSADVYALGVVAYHCLTGKPPFLGDNPLAVALQHVSEEPPPLSESIPGPVRDLVMTALMKDPETRFPSASAMADAADRLLSTAPTAGTGLAAATAGALGAAGATAVVAGTGSAGAAGTSPAAEGAGAVQFARGVAGAGVAPLTTPRPPLAARAALADTAIADGPLTGPAYATGALARQSATSGFGAQTGPAGPPGPPNAADTRSSAAPDAPGNSNKRRNLALLSVLLIALLGTGTFIAVADPFKLFSETAAPAGTPATTAPASKAPASKDSGSGNSGRGNNDNGNSGSNSGGDREKDRTASPTPKKTTPPAAPATTEPETDPTTEPTTQPAEDPTTATTEPETTTQPTDEPDENENEQDENEQESTTSE